MELAMPDGTVEQEALLGCEKFFDIYIVGICNVNYDLRYKTTLV